MALTQLPISKLLRASISPAAWLRQFKRWQIAGLKSKKWIQLDAAFSEYLKLPSQPSGAAVLCEGMWDNPNQYFRLRLFLEAVPEIERQCLIAVIRTPQDRSRKSLEALGFTKFYCLSDTPITSDDYQVAKDLLKGIKNHHDLMSLDLPSGLPPKIPYDTAIKIAQSPQPKLGSKIWEDCIADCIRLDRFYNEVFNKETIKHVIYSHPWKNEYGAAAWKSIQHKIPFYHLNGEYETMRIRKITDQHDFNTPIEMLSYAEFCKLSEHTQNNLKAAGSAYLKQRGKVISTDVNDVMAFGNKETAENLKKRLNLPNDKPIILVCFHAWVDFPHSFDMQNFTDFTDWTKQVLKQAYAKDNVIWLLKPHPAEPWYGSFFLKDLVIDPPSQVILLEDNVSALAAQDIADAVVTVHGTVAMEASSKKIPVLASDKSFYMDWKFATTAHSLKEFQDHMQNIESLPAPSDNHCALAGAFTYLCVAPVEQQTGLLRLKSDHLGPDELFDDIIGLTQQEQVIEEQVALVREWLESGTKSFSVFHKIKLNSGSTNLQ